MRQSFDTFRSRPRAGGLRLQWVVFLVLALGGAGAQAQGPQGVAGLAAGDTVALAVSLGFSGTFRPGRWAPLTVVASNRGADLDGWLEVLSSDGDAFRGELFQITHRRRLQLTRDGRKRFHFTVYLESLSRPVTVRILAGGRELARHTVDLRRHFTADRLLLVVSRDADLDYLNASAPGGRGLRVLYPLPERLPHRWQGYDGVSALVLHGVSLERLSGEQHAALERWVAQGGVLAVSGDPDYGLLRTPRLASLLPALPVGTVALRDPGGVGAALGGRPALGAASPVLVHRVTGLRGTVLRAVPQAALVLERRLGAGRVLYLTFDVARPPFDRWPGMPALWRDVLRLPADDDAFPARADRDATSPVKDMLVANRRGFPAHSTVLFFLALYLGILATAYRMRPSRAPGRWLLHLCTWGLPLTFAPVAWLLFSLLLFERGAAAAVVALVEPLTGSRYARLDLHLGLYSNRRGRVAVAYEGALPVFRIPLRSRPEAGAGAWLFAEDAPARIEPVDTRRYALHLLQGRDVIPYAVSATIARAGRALELRLRNGSGRTLRQAWLVAGGRGFALGDVPADGAVERRLDGETDGIPVDPQVWPTLFAESAGRADPQREATRALLARALREHGAGEAALLIARSRSPLRLRGPASGFELRELVLVLMRVPDRGPAMAHGRGDGA